jgi:SPP1 family predicted phage head-tail adaptor
MIDPGKLRERVTVQQATQSRNSLGEAVMSWADWQTVWASVEGVSAREALAAGQMEVTISHRVRLRYLTGLAQNMRLSWRGRTLDIVSILEHNNRSEHEVICQETRDG